MVFSPSTDICWIQTGDGAYTNQTNCMLMAARLDDVGDGVKKTLFYKREDGRLKQVTTQIGTAKSDATLKRFLVGPKGAEITGHGASKRSRSATRVITKLDGGGIGS